MSYTGIHVKQNGKNLNHFLTDGYFYQDCGMCFFFPVPRSEDLNVKWKLNEGQKYCRMLPLEQNGSLIMVKSIAECSPWSILQYFRPELRVNWS